VYGRWRDSGLYPGLWLELPLAVGFALVRLIRGPRLPLPQSELLLCVTRNILFLAVVGNTIEVGENNRFRFTTDALSVTLLAAGCVWTCERVRTRRATHGAAQGQEAASPTRPTLTDPTLVPLGSSDPPRLSVLSGWRLSPAGPAAKGGPRRRRFDHERRDDDRN